jgi:hypothetical protein
MRCGAALRDCLRLQASFSDSVLAVTYLTKHPVEGHHRELLPDLVHLIVLGDLRERRVDLA